MSPLHSPTISVVIPVYNAAAYLAEAIQSILDQTFTDFEMIIIDDASTDDSYAIAQTFTDPRIRMLRNEQNRGIVYTRNRGLAEIKGQFYAPFDADDVAMPHKLAKQIAFLQQHPTFGMVGCWAQHIDSHGHLLAEKWKLNASPEAILPILLFRNYFVQSALLIRREAIPAEGYETGFDIGEDYLMWIAIAEKYQVWNLPEYLLTYRRHGQSTTSKDPEALSNYDHKIQRYIFNYFGVPITDQEIALLLNVKDSKPLNSLAELRDVEQLLLKIGRAFEKLWPEKIAALNRATLNRWLKACYLARNMHINTLYCWVTSVLWLRYLRAEARMLFQPAPAKAKSK